MHRKSQGPSTTNIHDSRTIPVLEPRSLSISPVPDLFGPKKGWGEAPRLFVGFPTVPQHLGVLLHRITIAPHQCHKPRDGGQLGWHDISHGEDDFGSQLNRAFDRAFRLLSRPWEFLEQYKYCGRSTGHEQTWLVWGGTGMIGMIIG